MEIDFVSAFIRLADDVSLDPYSISYCVRRIKFEGYKFLTETLPKLSRAVLSSLEKGYFDRTEIKCFAWKGRSLRYFRSLLSGVFDTDGLVRSDADALSIWRIRQLSEYFYKLCLDMDSKKLEEAECTYISIEKELSKPRRNESLLFCEQIRKTLETLVPSIFNVPVSKMLSDFGPRFGPGSFLNSSPVRLPYYIWKQLPEKQVGTCTKSMRPNAGFFKPYRDSGTKIKLVPDEPKLCEVMFVPKDSRGPRTISKEAPHRLRLQLSFFDFIASAAEKHTRGRVNFRDQSINRNLAKVASSDKTYSTLDLKEASDRVKCLFVRRIFRNSPVFRHVLQHRAEEALLPISKKRIKIRKLAGMGSGLTFGTMSLIIWGAIVSYVHQRTKLSKRLIAERVYVYGDDVIVPTEWYAWAYEALELVDLQINSSKSFTASNFRESCGGDYFMGQDVVPVRLKLTNAKGEASGRLYKSKSKDFFILELERHCRELWLNGHLSLMEYYYSIIEKYTGKLPSVSGRSPYLGRYCYRSEYGMETNGNYSHTKAILPVPVTVKAATCPYKYLGGKIKSENRLDPLEYLDCKSQGSAFGEVGVPRQVKLRRVKVSAFALMG